MSRTKPGYAIPISASTRPDVSSRPAEEARPSAITSLAAMARWPQPWKARTRFRRADGGHRGRVGKGQHSTALSLNTLAQHQLLKVVLQCEVARRAGAVL